MPLPFEGLGVVRDLHRSPPMTCSHVGDLPTTVVPTSRRCEACVTAGSPWVHLRMCLGCGEVGCCDSSPMRHADVHAREAGHPVMRSVEPGEVWRWCYVDQELV